MNFTEYPYTPHVMPINGLSMHYLDEGPATAEPIIMVHGNPSWSYFFRKPVHALREHYRCIVPDHIGMGLSAKPRDGQYNHTLLQRIDDLEALLEALDIRENITLVLHDWGGMIGMGYACRHPARIKRLVLLNTAAFHLPKALSLPWQLKLARTRLIGAFLVQGCNAFCRGAITLGVVRRPVFPAVKHAYLAPYDSWHNRLAVLRFIHDIPLEPDDAAYTVVTGIENGLAQFRQLPVLICWGMKDFVFTEGFLKAWEDRFPDAEINRFAEAGHYLLEDAGDETILLIRQFLDRHPSGRT
jgi:haloalkane dehalogenase